MKVTDIKVKFANDAWGPSGVTKRTRIYVFPKGETVLANLENRHQRPYNVYRKEVIPAVLEHLGTPDAKVSWSQRAGCSCPCSPGFVIKEGDWGREVFVTVE